MVDDRMVSVVMPVRDEAESLDEAVTAILRQRAPVPFEVILSVAPSSDDTEEIAASLAGRDPRVRVVPNPKGLTPAGLNAAIDAARGDIIVRVDGHAELSDGYISRALELLDETGADNVGGIQRAVGTTPFQQAVAAAMSSRFGVGDAKFHYGGEPGPTDTVYLGVFRRSAIERAGGFDEALVRNQDYELNWRIRATGGVVYFHPALEVRYRPRSTWRALARQYFEYGQWKREVLRRHPGSLRWRQLAPPAALIANLGGLALGVLGHPVGFAIPGTYAAVTVLAALVAGDRAATRARLPLVFATMHHAWAMGVIIGPRQHVQHEVSRV